MKVNFEAEKKAIDKALNEINTKKNEHAAAIEEAKKAIEKAQEILSKSIESGDAAAYKAAKQDIREAEDLIEFHTEMLKVSASGSEYKNRTPDILAAIHRQQEGNESTARKEIARRLVEIFDISNASADLIEEGNNLIRKWLFDVCKEAPETIVNKLYSKDDQLFNYARRYMRSVAWAKITGIKYEDYTWKK